MDMLLKSNPVTANESWWLYRSQKREPPPSVGAAFYICDAFLVVGGT